jgi:hypothetical protein
MTDKRIQGHKEWLDTYKKNMRQWGFEIPAMKTRADVRVGVTDLLKNVTMLYGATTVPMVDVLALSYCLAANLQSAAAASDVSVGLPENFTLQEVNHSAKLLGVHIPSDIAMGIAIAVSRHRASLQHGTKHGGKHGAPHQVRQSLSKA